MIDEELLTHLEDIVSYCEHRGAQAEVMGLSKEDIVITVERNQVTLCISQNIGGVGIRTSIDNAIGFATCNSLNTSTTQKTAQKALSMSKKTPPALHEVFALPGPLPTIQGLYDPEIHTFDEGQAINTVQDMISQACEDPRIMLDNGEFQVSVRNRAIATSSGISHQEKKSRFSWFLIGLAREGGDVGSFVYEYGGATHVKDLSCADTAHVVSDQALRNLHAQKVESFTGDCILGPEAVSSLMGYPLVFALNAHNVHREQSMLAEKMNTSICADIITIEDNPTLPHDINSGRFDREGTPHQQVVMVQDGVLQTFMYDALAAHREDHPPTGNATGSFREIPKVGIKNLIIDGKSRELETIIVETEKGILVNRFSGATADVSGDFSGSLKGTQLISGGERQYTTKEVTIAGNLFDILPRISDISVETRTYPQMILPYMKIPQMQFIS
jgi:PmbA protein